jgi:FixJ family two-component response regulator
MIKTPTVQVVDDDAGVRNALVRLISITGHTARGFDSAANYLTSGIYLQPGCLLLDFSLPDMSGLQLQQELVNRHATVPIVFISGFGDVPLTVQAMKLGAVDFLTKPIQEAALLAAIDNALAVEEAGRNQRVRDDDIRAHFNLLTARERDVLNGVLFGRLNKQIARQLGISEKTVKVHRGRVMAKLGIRHVAQLAQLAAQIGYQAVDAGAAVVTRATTYVQ